MLISRGLISGVLYSVAYIRAANIEGAYIPNWHTDSEQVTKRLSPNNSKELHNRFTCPCKRQNLSRILSVRAATLVEGENVTNGPKYSKGPKCKNH